MQRPWNPLCEVAPRNRPDSAPLKRYIQRELETRIGRAIVGGDILDAAKIVVDVKDSRLDVTHQNPERAEPDTAETPADAAR